MASDKDDPLVDTKVHHSIVKDRINGITCETAYYNADDELIGWWAYGYFDPNLPYQGARKHVDPKRS